MLFRLADTMSQSTMSKSTTGTTQKNKLSQIQAPTNINVEAVKKERAMAIAFGEGLKYGILGVAVAGTSTLLASRFHSGFRKYMSLSAKTSLPVMAGLFCFCLKFELSLSSIARTPEIWGLADNEIISGKITRIPIHHQVMNYMYDRPFVVILGLGTPFAGTILYKQLQLTHIKFSQRLMHTRVFAQAGIISIALTTMAFREYMDKRGRFPEPTD